jgi:hypothetical protein
MRACILTANQGMNVIPAKAGIQPLLKPLEPDRVRRDGLRFLLLRNFLLHLCIKFFFIDDEPFMLSF